MNDDGLVIPFLTTLLVAAICVSIVLGLQNNEYKSELKIVKDKVSVYEKTMKIEVITNVRSLK